METYEYQTFSDLFVDIVNRHAEKVFIDTVGGDECYTYSEFGKRVFSISEVLLKQGVSSGEPVLLCLSNSPDFFAFFSAVILAGGVPVLSNPAYTTSEIAHICESAAANYAIADNDKAAMLEELKGVRIIPTSFFGALNRLSKENPDAIGLPALEPHNTAYIIYSSGSTARPKGCLVSHANLVGVLQSMIRAYALPDDCVHLCVLPVFHASALYRNILIPFAQGAKTVIANDFDVEQFWGWIDTYSIGFVQTVPAILRSLLDHPSIPSQSARQSLQYIGSASAPLQTHTIELFEERFSIPIAQGYGLTETTCGTCFNDPRRGGRKLHSVGKPIDIATVAILDDSGAPVATGEIGEIVISGPLVVTNYLNNGENRSHKVVGGRLYTADLGRLDEDGYLTIESRKTDMIVRAGFNISPREIEDALATLEGIEGATVFSIPHQSMGEDIIAYVHCADGANPKEKDLRKALKDRLAPYKIPTRILPFESSYSTQNFKISRSGFRRHYLEHRKALLNEKKHHASSTTRKSHPEKPRAFLWDDIVYLRPLMDADTKSSIYLDNIMDPGAQYFTYSGRFPQSEKSIQEYWESVSPPDHIVLAICDMKTDNYVGNISLRIDWIPRIAEFGRMIFKEYQSQPYSEHALRLVMEYAFDDLKLKRLWGGGSNPTSVPTLVRLGFSHEGTLRRHHFLRGEWRDQFLFGILDSDFKSIKNGHRPNFAHKRLPDGAEDILTQIKTIFAETFDIAPEDITPATSSFDIPAWDSLGMVTLWNLLEEHFRVPISSSDMVCITCVGDIMVMLSDKINS